MKQGFSRRMAALSWGQASACLASSARDSSAGRSPRGRNAIALLACGLLAPVAWADCALQRAELPVKVVEYRPIATITLNGTEVPMLFNTASFFSMLPRSTAEQLNLPLHNAPSWLTVSTNYGREPVRMTRVASVEMMGVKLANIEFLVGGSELNGGVRGILGRNLFPPAADMELDLSHGMVRMVAPQGDCGKSSMAYWAGEAPVIVMPLLIDGPKDLNLRTEVKVNGKTMAAHISTGAPTSYITLKAAARAGMPDSALKPAGRFGGGERVVKQWRARFDLLEVGGEKVANSQLTVSDEQSDDEVILGLDYLLAHRVYISRQQRLIYITWNGGPVFVQPKEVADGQYDGRFAAPAETLADDDADGLARRGQAALAKGDAVQALADLERAIALKPKDPGYRVALARAHIQVENRPKAIADLDEALRLDATLLEARMIRAQLHASLLEKEGPEGKSAQMVELARLDAELPPSSALRSDLGRVFARYDMNTEAQRQWDLWLTSHPFDRERASVFNEKCWLRTRLGIELAQALESCEAAVVADKGAYRLQDSLGWTYLRMGEAAKARKAFDRALALKKDFAWSLYGRAMAGFQLKDERQGRSDLAAARELTPTIEQEVRQAGFDFAAGLMPSGT